MRDALKGHVDLLLLPALEDEPAHGYELVETIRARSEGAFDLAEGTVYPSLYRLERRHLVASGWETSRAGAAACTGSRRVDGGSSRKRVRTGGLSPRRWRRS